MGEEISSDMKQRSCWEVRRNKNGRPKGAKNKNPYPKEAATKRNRATGAETRRKNKLLTPEERYIKYNRNPLGNPENLWKSMKGLYKPRNPQKYAGDVKNIIYRSSWELKMMYNLDSDPDVISWASEELKIPYFNPVYGRIRNYYPDFLIQTKKDGTVQNVVMEIKPENQVRSPIRRKGQHEKTYLRQLLEWNVNQAKWKAARQFCEEKKMKFAVITENQLGIGYGQRVGKFY